MRVTRRQRERGATTAIAALFLTAALGLSALVVDVGNSWQERRHLVTATDSAALAAAQEYVTGGDGCAISGNSVTANNPDATSTCAHTPPTGGAPGRVRVEGQANVNFIFAGALGAANTTVNSSTTVNYDLASAVEGGLRPFGLCFDLVTNLTPTMVPDNGHTYRIYYGKDAQPSACNGGDPVPGNWGILDFNGGANSQNDTKDWTEYGYDGEVKIGDWIEGSPGAFSNSLNSELQSIVYPNVDHFALPIFSEYNDLPGGNAEFLIYDFVAVRLHGFKANGPEKDRYLDIEFLNKVVQGTGGGTGTGLGAFVIGICGVDGVNDAVTCS